MQQVAGARLRRVLLQVTQQHVHLGGEGQALGLGILAGIGDVDLGAARRGHGTAHAVGQQIGEHAGVETAHGIADGPGALQIGGRRGRQGRTAGREGRGSAPRFVDREVEAPYRLGQAAEVVLPHQDGAVGQLGSQVQTGIDDGQDHAAHLQKTAEQAQHRREIALEMQIAPGKQQVAHAGFLGAEIIGHALQEIAQMHPHHIGHDRRQGTPAGMPGAAHGAQTGAQGLGISLRGQAHLPEVQYALRDHAVCQGGQTIADVPHGGQGKSFAQGGGTAARIEGRHQMDGIVGVTGKTATQAPEGRTAGEEDQPGTKGGQEDAHAASPVMPSSRILR